MARLGDERKSGRLPDYHKSPQNYLTSYHLSTRGQHRIDWGGGTLRIDDLFQIERIINRETSAGWAAVRWAPLELPDGEV
jgi:hypothetical protein